MAVNVVVAAAIFAGLAGVAFKMFRVPFVLAAVLIAGVMLAALLPLLPTIVQLGLMALA